MDGFFLYHQNSVRQIKNWGDFFHAEKAPLLRVPFFNHRFVNKNLEI